MNNNKLALKAGTAYIISSFTLKAITILTTPIYTRILSQSDYGITNVYTTWLSIFSIIATLDVVSSIMIAKHQLPDVKMESYVSSILTLSSMFLIIMYIFIKSLGDNFIYFLNIPSFLIDFLFLETFLLNAFTISQTLNKSQFQYKQFIKFTAVIAVFSPIFAISFISLQENNYYLGKIIGEAIPKLVISVILFLIIIRKGSSFVNLKYWKFALIVSIPLIPHHLSGIILGQFDKIIINKYLGSVDTAIYSLAYSYTSLLSISWLSLNSAWSPWFYDKMKNKDFSIIKNYSKPYIIVFSIIYLVLLTIGPELLRILGPVSYQEGVWIIPPVLLGILFQFLYSLYVNIEFYHKKTVFITLGTLFAGLLNIVLNIIYIPKYGYIAASYTTLISLFLLFIIHYFISKKIDKNKIFDNYFIFTFITYIILTTILINILYDKLLFRYIFLILLLIIIVIIYNKKIIKFYYMIRRKN